MTTQNGNVTVTQGATVTLVKGAAGTPKKTVTAVAVATALDKEHGAIIVKAGNVLEKAVNVLEKAQGGLYGFIVRANIAGATWDGLAIAEPSLVAAKFANGTNADGTTKYSRTPMAQAYGTGKSVVQRANERKIALTDDDGKVIGKSAIEAKIKAFDIAKEGAKESGAVQPSTVEGKSTVAPVADGNAVSPNEAIGIMLQGMMEHSAHGFEMRATFGEMCGEIATLAGIERVALAANIALMHQANVAAQSSRGLARLAAKAKVKADAEALAAEYAKAGMTKGETALAA